MSFLKSGKNCNIYGTPFQNPIKENGCVLGCVYTSQCKNVELVCNESFVDFYKCRCSSKCNPFFLLNPYLLCSHLNNKMLSCGIWSWRHCRKIHFSSAVSIEPWINKSFRKKYRESYSVDVNIVWYLHLPCKIPSIFYA